MELREISQKELDYIVRLHKKWLDGDNEGVKADLSHTDLISFDLRHVNLTLADLSWSNLRGADLSCSNLRRANLICSNLSDSILREANLDHSDLRGADLGYSNLRRANLSYSDLSGANLRRSCLIETNLKNVTYNNETQFLVLQCPEEGSFIGYKKSANKIVKLRIEEDSLRSSATSRKCRASKVTVLSITNLDGTKEFKKVSNTGDYKFTYKVGKTYEIKDFDTDRWNECSTGIHFFVTRDEAVKYQ